MDPFFRIHQSFDAFRQALSFTEAETGFVQRLIEKDYYCSLILADFAPLFDDGLVFKGGTSLSKVHAGFYRLSEDLDFAVSTPTDARRPKRRALCAPIKQHLEHIAHRLPSVSLSEQLTGHDQSRQYNAGLRYRSVITGEYETVKVEVALREPAIDPAEIRPGQTLLRDPLFDAQSGSSLNLRVLSLRETYAEKVRAALTRSAPAIRDFFDIEYAIRNTDLDLSEPAFLRLVRRKLSVPRVGTVDVSVARFAAIERQKETQLRPVLRYSDYAAFDLQNALKRVAELAAAIPAE